MTLPGVTEVNLDIGQFDYHEDVAVFDFYLYQIPDDEPGRDIVASEEIKSTATIAWRHVGKVVPQLFEGGEDVRNDFGQKHLLSSWRTVLAKVSIKIGQKCFRSPNHPSDFFSQEVGCCCAGSSMLA